MLQSRWKLELAVLLIGASLLGACASDKVATDMSPVVAAGKDGKDGADGSDGTDGKNGAPGANGEDGTSPTAAQLAAAANSAANSAVDNKLGDAIDGALNALARGCDAIAMDQPDDGVQLQMPLATPAGKEREYCQLVLLDRDINLNWSDGEFTVGSHHALIETTPYKDVIPTTTVTGATIADASKPHPCSTPTAVWQTSGVISRGRSVEAAKLGDGPEGGGDKGILPADVAFKLKKGDVILINFHMINTTDQEIAACYKINLHGIAESKVAHEAGTLFFYNPFITVAGETTGSARMACPITKNISLRSAVSHMHSRGDGYVATLLDKSPADPTNAVVRELYSGTEWDEPIEHIFKTPLALTAGQWIDYECHYTNPEARNVAQGFASTDEMCMFIGTYWPKDAALETCSRAASVGKPASNSTASIGYGSGPATGTTKNGADFLGCWWSSPRVTSGTGDDPKRFQTLSCFTQTCPQASPPQRPYLSCLGENSASCQSECTTSQASFQAVCALTPGAGTTGCKEEYGTTGSNGTCAAGATNPAIAACTTAGQVNAYIEECQTTLCATPCGTGAAECSACLGSFDGDPNNTTCMNILVGSCVKDQATKIATKCNTDCFTPCITAKVTGCTVDCLNEEKCKTEYGAVATAVCN
jgi:hypothetical protein